MNLFIFFFQVWKATQSSDSYSQLFEKICNTLQNSRQNDIYEYISK